MFYFATFSLKTFLFNIENIFPLFSRKSLISKGFFLLIFLHKSWNGVNELFCNCLIVISTYNLHRFLVIQSYLLWYFVSNIALLNKQRNFFVPKTGLINCFVILSMYFLPFIFTVLLLSDSMFLWYFAHLHVTSNRIQIMRIDNTM